VVWVSKDADSRSGNPIFVSVLIRSQNAQYFPRASDGKFDVTQIKSVIYQMNWIFKENSDLESVFCIDALQHLQKLGDKNRLVQFYQNDIYMTSK
jgi:hypothetical protein